MALRSPPPSFSFRDAATRRAEAELIDLLKRCRTDKVQFARSFFGIEPTPYQVEVLSGTGKVDVAVAGRRVGKTLATTIRAVHELATGLDRVGYVGAPSLDQSEQLIREIALAAERSPNMVSLLAGGPTKAIHRASGFPTVDFVTGSSLHARATVQNGRYLRGKGAHFVVLTEAAFVADEVYDRAVRPLVLDRQGTIYLDSSPNGDTFFKRVFDRATESTGRWAKASRNGYYSTTHATIFDNPRLAREDIDAIREEIPEYAWRTEYLAEFIESGDAVFSWELLSALFDYDYGQIGQSARATKRYAIGVDLAQTADYTCIIVMDISDGRPPYRLAHWRRFRGIPYMGAGGVVDQVTQLQRAFGGARVFVDATSEKAVAESIPNAQPVVFTGPSRTEMLSHLIVLCENKQLALPAKFTALRDEMRALRRHKLPSGGVRADHPRDGNDDTVWALALACRAISGKHVMKPVEPAIAEAFRNMQWHMSDTHL